MLGEFTRVGFAAAIGLLAVGAAGCSSLSTNHVDCNVVKLQSEAGRSDDEIASALGASVKDVAACHGPEKSGNGASGGGGGSY
jgi:hypothetical protein